MTILLKPSRLKPALVIGPYGVLQVDAGVSVNGFNYSGSAVSLPTLVAGEDYKVYVGANGTPFALHYDSVPSDPDSALFSGFHYSPGGLATDVGTGGTAIAQINPFSMWDIKFCPDSESPRGMTKIGHLPVWADIYFCNVNHHALGTSRNNQLIATGSKPPERAYDFGGAGSAKYVGNLMWNYWEVLAQHGKRPGTYREHCMSAFGVKENIGRGSHPQKTGLGTDNIGLNAPDHFFTSKWGVIQSTGCVWAITETPAPWRGDEGPQVAGAPANNIPKKEAWDAYDITGGATNGEPSRGRAVMQTDTDCAYVMHGGKWSYNIICGSRGFENIEKLFDSSPNFAARGFAGHHWES